MVGKLFLILSIFIVCLNGDMYEKNCVSCHKKLPVSIDKYFYRYLLKYSSKKDTKEAMMKYLTNPTKESTVMPKSFISRFGIKKKSKLNEEELKETIEIYWDKYDVSKRLR
ncbi:MAG: hypothetical protein U9N02_06110 [Campylobacterota bacterium]|nr:hypothetical protein [Campylobacterota bacterium]